MPKSVKRARMTSTGLCSTCVNDFSCTFPRKAEAPVMHCLEFEGETRDDRQTGHGVPQAWTPESAPREPGLCTWCDNKPTCTFPKSVGGVWSCEEFR